MITKEIKYKHRSKGDIKAFYATNDTGVKFCIQPNYECQGESPVTRVSVIDIVPEYIDLGNRVFQIKQPSHNFKTVEEAFNFAEHYLVV